MSERLKPQVKTIVTLTPRHGEDHPSSPALSRRPPLVIIHPDAQQQVNACEYSSRTVARVGFAMAVLAFILISVGRKFPILEGIPGTANQAVPAA